MANYPNAWRVDTVSGGPLDAGKGFNYVGEDTMAREVQLGKQYGGVMVWELMGDAPAPHSLLQVIHSNL
jgi:chitinase